MDWQKLARIYDRLTEQQRLLIGCVGVVLAIGVSWGIVIWVIIDVMRFFLR